jgi:hypothetical protein
MHAVSQKLVNALEGGALDVQVEQRSTTVNGNGIVELKAMGLRIM